MGLVEAVRHHFLKRAWMLSAFKEPVLKGSVWRVLWSRHRYDRRWKGLRLMLPGGPPETQDVSFLPYPPSPQLPITGSRLCLYEDGTELTGDYFSSVPDNSELVLLTSGQTWQGYVSDIHHFLHAFHKPQAGLIQAARQLLSGEQAPLRQKLLADLLHTVSENTEAETRAEDPPWFEGLESRFKNKSGYLRYSCESRIRSYLREVSASASTVGAEAQEEYVRIVGLMCRKLRAEQYHSSYFDRGAEADSRLCTPEGWFSCQGPFDVDSCASKHSINPYGNRESRILFSTWNLDHIVSPCCRDRWAQHAAAALPALFLFLVFTSSVRKLYLSVHGL
ncbi:DNA fragmentation factor subunit beta isoform X4 [Leopardus geoffroyi]|uniref:DNA fragmentation factor subunit beta isoform X4 n=1 Tax=Leopardus geoffroyi TaxID=46844 RepID=UPI001E262F2E|nr:DNA fragmentation factor subunit beta isoform X4 [Leopardus geoffroyi]